MEKVDITRLDIDKLKVLYFDKVEELKEIRQKMKEHPLTKASIEVEGDLRLIRQEIAKKENPVKRALNKGKK